MATQEDNVVMNDSNNASPAAPPADQSPPAYQPENKQNGGSPRTTTVGSDLASSDEFDDFHIEWGWGGFRPRILQCLNKPHWFLVFLCLFAITQGITVNGLVYVVTTTLEKRFELPSAKSGSISSAYDFSVMVVIIFVTYFGENRHKPKMLAFGALTFALGSFVFTLPHYLSPRYEFSSGKYEVCDVSRDEPECMGSGGELSRYFWVFVIAQFLHGLGASPLYTLGITYIDENVRPKLTGLYIGIFNGASLLGPAIGYLFGGLLLSIYTDVTVDPDSLGIDPNNPVWIGAWWIGFLFTCALALCLVLPFLAFPKSLPGSGSLAKERVSEAHGGSDFSARAGFGAGLLDFPKACFDLLKNIPFMCICGAAAAEWFLLAGFAVFAPKFLESQFSLASGWAAILVGLTVIPAGVGGSVAGGYLVKRFSLKYRGMMRLCVATIFCSFLLLAAFLVTCPDPNFAGVTVNYDGMERDGEVNLTSSCNMGCSCDDQFQPVCGINNVIYYSPCHAGCVVAMETEDGNNAMYSDCRCIEGADGENVAVSGKCEGTCTSLPYFLIMLFLLEFATVLAVVPSTTATIRCVSHSQRSFALGLQSLIYRALGTVPGPIVIGRIIDNACLLMQPSCSGEDNDTCWLYENRFFSRSMLFLAAGIKVISVLFFLAALFSYKRPSGDDDVDSGKKGKDGSNGNGASIVPEEPQVNGHKDNGHATPLQEFT